MVHEGAEQVARPLGHLAPDGFGESKVVVRPRLEFAASGVLVCTTGKPVGYKYSIAPVRTMILGTAGA